MTLLPTMIIGLPTIRVNRVLRVHKVTASSLFCTLLAGIIFLLPMHAWSATSSGRADAAWQAAHELLADKRYADALAAFRRLQLKYPRYENISAVQTRIAVLHEAADAGESLNIFLLALDDRDAGRLDAALGKLDRVIREYPAGSLTDDALYLIAYLQVMDRYDFPAARMALLRLKQRFPDSAYRDSADYLDAIALEQLGETGRALDALTALRERHTSLSLPMGFRWPVGNVLSRYWFDRADRRIAIVETRLDSASTLRSRSNEDDGRLRLAVNVDGIDMRLLLSPSPLTRNTAWLDGGLADQLPPALGVYDGVVEGIADSWARVVLQQDSITGAVYSNGRHHRLLPANLIGTLDYYQPKQGKQQPQYDNSGSPLADSLQGLDGLIAPPDSLRKRSRGVSGIALTDVRAVPISIVVDSQYDRYFGGAGLATALNNLNVADGIYRQFGLALSLDEALTFADGGDPMAVGPATLENLLRNFRDYRLQQQTLFSGSALSYLFTGNPKTDVTLGLAWIDTACRSDGYDVGVTTPSTFGDVLLTHELGHSLGAQHDTDTSCNTNPLSLMWPNISPRTETRLSSCSAASVLSSSNRDCLKNTIDLVLSAHGQSDYVFFSIRNTDTALTLDAQLIVETSLPDQVLWPAGCQVQTPTSALCFVDSLAAGEERQVALPLANKAGLTSGLKSGPVTARVIPLDVLELTPDSNIATASPTGSSSEHLPLSAGAVVGLPQSGGVGEPAAGGSAGISGGGAAVGMLLLLLPASRRLSG
ncbi:MAG: M12 family metallo-peptidase [Granulosicoccus sp.]